MTSIPLFAAAERDLSLLRNRLTTLAGELLLKNGAHGCSVGDLRYSAENRGLLNGHESKAYMNALKLGKVMRDAGGISTGQIRRSRVRAAGHSANVIYALREFLPCDAGAA